METKNKYLLGILLSVFFLTLLHSTLTLGVVSVLAPAPYTNSSSSVVIYCNYSNGTDTTTPLVANTTFYQISSAGSQTAITVTAFGVNDTTVWATASASALIDGLNQQISCCVGNLTTAQTCSSTQNATNIGLYTSTPSCSFSLDSGTTTYLSPIGIETIDASTKDALATLSYAWTLYDPSFNLQTTSTSQEPTFTGTDLDEKGEFTVGLIITDIFGNSATCTNDTFFVKGKDGTAQAIVQSGITGGEGGIGITWILLIVVSIVVIITIVAFYIIKIGKRR